MLKRFFCVTVCLCFAVEASVGADSDPVPGTEWHKLDSPADGGWASDKLKLAREFSDTLDTAAMMIVQNGVVIDEWGATALPLNCHSVRKSLLSAIYGRHVESGAIDLDLSLQQLGINDNEPSLTDSERQATLRHLLKARSGVFHSALYETAAMAAMRPARGSHAPDTFWYYNNWDFNAAGSIFENLTGRSVFEEFQNQIARPLGMQDFRRGRDTKYVTGDDSVYPAYPFQLSTRDLARFGLLFLRNGKWKDRQLISESWIRESTASYSDTGASGGYGYMWWAAVDGKHFPSVTLPDGSYSARGHRGQYLVVIPEWDLLISHRVNSFQSGTAVSKTDFGKLLSLILAARPEKTAANVPDSANSSGHEDAAAFDLIIRNGIVIDGSGGERYRADVAVRDGVIVEIGMLPDATAKRVIDAAGRIVAPGFVDLHSHAEEGLVSEDPARRAAPNLITQGITTVVVNQDGGGPLSLADQRREMERAGVGLNVAQVIGHGTVRREIMGADHQRPATATEIHEMQHLIEASFRDGGFGMSAGLEYVPGRWSTPGEMESLAATVAAADGVYIVHERSSGSRPMWFLPSRDAADQPSMLDNLQELVDIVSATNVRTVATHIKARGTDFWGSSEQMNRTIQLARDTGLPLFADQYAYNTSGSDGRIVLIPSWANSHAESNAKDGRNAAELLEATLADETSASDLRRDVEYEIARRGGPENILIVEHPLKELAGISLAEYSKQLDSNAVEAAITLQLNGDRSQRGGARLRAFSMSEKDVEAFARTPWTATSSDAGIALPHDEPVHPRFYGAFPRKIRHYAIDRGLMSVEEAVRVSTSLPAGILKLNNRGLITKGACADLVVFDPEKIRDTADAFHPHQYAEGINYVFVNGSLVAEGQRCIGNLVGQVLSRASP